MKKWIIVVIVFVVLLSVVGVGIVLTSSKKPATNCSIEVSNYIDNPKEVWKCGLRSTPGQDNNIFLIGKIISAYRNGDMVWLKVDFGGTTRDLRLGSSKLFKLHVFERDRYAIGDNANSDAVKVIEIDDAGIKKINDMYGGSYAQIITMNPVGAAARAKEYSQKIGSLSGPSKERLQFGIDYAGQCPTQLKDFYSYLEKRSTDRELLNSLRLLIDNKYKNCLPFIESMWVIKK